jgi:hypothetical protein
MTRKKIRTLIKEELDGVTKIGQPVRRPFGNYTDYNQGRYGSNVFQDVTDKYNITYKAQHPGEFGFNEVLYSEPHNILIAFPSEDNADHDQPYGVFGLKAARGYGKDYRHLDRSMEGAGVYSMDEEQANSILDGPKEALQEIGSEYVRNFGGLATDGVLTESKNPPVREMKALEQAVLNEFGGNDKRAQVRKQIATKHSPPGYGGLVEQMRRQKPNVFGGKDPDINPNTIAWGIYGGVK